MTKSRLKGLHGRLNMPTRRMKGIVMPNHVHFVIVIKPSNAAGRGVGAIHELPLRAVNLIWRIMLDKYRKTIRIQDYDYSSPGAYFVTFCTEGRRKIFGEIIDEKGN